MLLRDLLQTMEASPHLFASCIRGNLSRSSSTNERTARIRSLQDLINKRVFVILQGAWPAGQPCHLPTNPTVHFYERTLSFPIGVRRHSKPLEVARSNRLLSDARLCSKTKRSLAAPKKPTVIKF